MRTTIWMTLWLCLASPALGNPIQLPDMGASSESMLSPQEESQVGKEVMRELHRSGKVFDDPFVEDYLEHLGYRLLATTDSATHFTFFTLDDSAINAFALPGGYVGINAGLVVASRSENELAGVVAHEIAHVTQRHIARSLEQQNRLNLPMTAAIVAALILGRQDPQVSEAAIMSVLAGSEQSRLDFSRMYEQEADRVGIGLLAQAGFDPEGMPTFFERLYQETRFAGGEESELEFLRTHPVTVSRIADSRNRASQYARRGLKKATGDYEFVKAILRVRTARHPMTAVRYFQNALKEGKARNRTAAQLGLVLALIDAGRPAEAEGAIAPVLKVREPSPLLLRVAAVAERSSGHLQKAEAHLRRGTSLYPEDRGLLFAYGRLLLDRKSYTSAARLVSNFLRRHASPRAYALLAEAEEGRGRSAAAHLAVAEQYYLLDEVTLAIDQLQVARRDPNADFYMLSRIDARLAELKALLPAKKQRSPKKQGPSSLTDGLH